MQRHALDQNVLTTIRADQRRTQIMLDAVRVDPIDALLDRRRARNGPLLLEPKAVGRCQGGKSPPCRRARLAIEDALVAFTGDRDVRFPESVDERGVIE